MPTSNFAGMIFPRNARVNGLRPKSIFAPQHEGENCLRKPAGRNLYYCVSKPIRKENMVAKPIILLFAAALTAPLPASADDAVVRHLTEADMVAALSAPRTTPPATQITQHAGYMAQLVQRKQSGMVEQHMDWNEIFIVQEG